MAGCSNLALIRHAATCLGDLCDNLVFLGGATTGLLLTDPAAGTVRSTLDVDVITEVSSRPDYYALESRLQAAGFSHDRTDGAPICRWRCGAVILDVMPTDSSILGFSNPWYAGAFQYAIPYPVMPDRTIRLVTAPYFIATKLAAFQGRGDGDYLASRDLEDILTVIDGRPELLPEIAACPEHLRCFLASEIARFLATPDFLEALPGHLPPDDASQQRLPIVLQRLHCLADNGRFD